MEGRKQQKRKIMNMRRKNMILGRRRKSEGNGSSRRGKNRKIRRKTIM